FRIVAASVTRGKVTKVTAPHGREPLSSRVTALGAVLQKGDGGGAGSSTIDPCLIDPCPISPYPINQCRNPQPHPKALRSFTSATNSGRPSAIFRQPAFS